MLGWEFPPFFAGGVGIACYELTKALLEQYQDIEIDYVIPYWPKDSEERGKLHILNADSKKIEPRFHLKKIESTLYAYDSPESYAARVRDVLKKEGQDGSPKNIKQIYGENIFEEIYGYAEKVLNLCAKEHYDLIHAHDWTTFPAALMLKKMTGIPVVSHVHITELNKTGGMGGDSRVFEIENQGFAGSDIAIAVSHFMKEMLIHHYGVDPAKIRVVHNGGVTDLNVSLEKNRPFVGGEKVVLFAGRMTLQKGPEYFVRAAKKVLEYEQNVKFVIAGGGDKLASTIELAAQLGISKNVLFFGAFSRAEADRLNEMADVFVMPSVSEPFGIVPLDAIAKGTPTVISKQSGISEVLMHTFKVDFWDVDEIAHKILSLLRYEPLHTHMREQAMKDFERISWSKAARETVSVYHELAH